MTWYWAVTNGTELEVWDHTQDPATDNPIQTRTQSSGWSWSEQPDVVKEIMYDEAKAAFESNDNQRTLLILADAAFERIEEVV